MYRMEGYPLVALAAIMQTSPLVWITLKDKDFATPHELIGRKLPVLTPNESAELLTVFRMEGLDLKQINFINHRATVDDLINNKVDAINGYIANEPFLLDQLGHQYNLIRPKNYGVNFYNDVLVTHEKFAKNNPEIIENFTAASLQGWQYALENIDETISIIRNKYAPNKSLEHLLYEAKVIQSLIMPELVQLGHMNPGRWQFIADTYKELNLTQGDNSIEGLIYTRPKADLTWFIHAIVLSLVIILVLLVITWRFAYLSSTLKREISRRQYAERKLIKANNELKAQASSDPLTQIYNRRAFFDKGQSIVRFATRKNYPMSLLMIDIDYFKKINDQYGHAAGDLALQKVCDCIKAEVIRSHDIFARIGGEEFAILMVDCDLKASENVADRIHKRIQELHIPWKNSQSFTLTVSIGIAPVTNELSESLTQADIALYRAKQNGRNCHFTYIDEDEKDVV
ncbi:GGDEF domain-containing protein [Catenovulum sediminis]|uniref:GGDEF domain-containing protein n=1 Tax=Catenovulum sediminis TaxID=1740262 RepID=UPI002483103D|nr:GGDEF domain-containing protein [Catenovulum sediminis]